MAVGLAIGAGAYNPHSPAVLGTQGVLNAVSAGILIFNGLVPRLVKSIERSSSELLSPGSCRHMPAYAMHANWHLG